jgi:hypothetical protein
MTAPTEIILTRRIFDAFGHVFGVYLSLARDLEWTFPLRDKLDENDRTLRSVVGIHTVRVAHEPRLRVVYVVAGPVMLGLGWGRA